MSDEKNKLLDELTMSVGISNTNLELRPEVAEFALAIESRLKENDKFKGDSWKEIGVGRLCKMLNKELGELWVAIGKTNPERIQHKAADVAAFVMFIFQNAMLESKIVKMRQKLAEVNQLRQKMPGPCDD